MKGPTDMSSFLSCFAIKKKGNDLFDDSHVILPDVSVGQVHLPAVEKASTLVAMISLLFIASSRDTCTLIVVSGQAVSF